jgi:EAL domain-containing protein (putative c-di-GMP-specific phosphodiesterase class I)
VPAVGASDTRGTLLAATISSPTSAAAATPRGGSTVQRLPVDEIKIDRSFLQRADLDALDDSVAIIGAIVDLGHRLGREVVAEGVEDEASWAILRNLGCDSAQGYWMSRPMPTHDFLPWLEAWRPTAVAALRVVR